MPSGDEALERLRAAVDRFPADEVGELLAEARAEARARVRSMLSEALTDSLLAQAQAAIERRPSPPAPEIADRPTRLPPEEPAWYVYGVLDAREEAVAAGLRGIGEEPIATVTEGQVAAVYSHVPRDEFDESELRTHLSDMAWVEKVARGHEAVLDELCRRTTVIPMRMCTVYQTEARVREMLEREQHPLQETIEHLEGKHEWGVQAVFHRDRASLDAAIGEAADAPGESSGSAGAAYMQRRRRERDAGEQLEQLVTEATQEIHDSLATVSADSALNPPQRPEASGRAGEMVLNGVYLVQDSAKDAFDDRVRELQSTFSSTGLELLITGPWPPYNFLPGSIGAAW
jgi:hypothetical protein